MRVKTLRLRCRRCEHTWRPRGSRVLVCPACKSAYFAIPRIALTENNSNNDNSKRKRS